MDAQRKIEKVAARQFGTFSRAQALTFGLSPEAISRRLSSKQWIQLFPKVYRLASAPRTPQQSLMGGLLWAGEDSLASHRSAVWLLGLGDFKPDIVELTLPRFRRPPAGISVHVSTKIPNCDRSRKGPVRVTSVARTLIDLGAVVERDAVEIALEEALRRRLTSLEQLERRLADLISNGRKGPGVLKDILDRRYPGTWLSGSTLEVRVLQLLRRNRFPLPVPQFEIRNNGHFVARVDYAYPDINLILECESWQYHSDREPWYRDVRRYNEVASLGWRVITATDEDIGDPTLLIKDLSLQFKSPSDVKREQTFAKSGLGFEAAPEVLG